MTKKLKEFKNWIEEYEDEIKAGVIIAGSCIVCYAFGICTGKAARDIVLGKGLDECFKVDPTLKEHLVNAIAEASKKQMME